MGSSSVGRDRAIVDGKRRSWTINGPRAQGKDPRLEKSCGGNHPRRKRGDQPRGTMRCTDAHHARVAELVDASDSKSDGLRVLWVRVPPRVPNRTPAPNMGVGVSIFGPHASEKADQVRTRRSSKTAAGK